MFVDKIKSYFQGFNVAVSRYPLVLLFLLVIAVVNIVTIQDESETYLELLYALIIGAWLSAIAQQIYERFFTQMKEKVMLYLCVLLLTISYYIVINLPVVVNMEVEIKTAVLVFALFIAFIWVPSIRNTFTFDKSFIVVIKAVFTTLLFTAVIALGINLIIFAVDYLLVAVNSKIYSHIFNVILTLFAPLFFLSFIPSYANVKKVATDEQKEKIDKSFIPSTLFVKLLSYVIIPLAGAYTLILILYILLNIRSGFWADNLLEPMLVSYSITIILITLLVTRIDNQFASIFKKLMPKILLPIVLLQVIASILKIGELGLTHGRYYVILFGIFAFIASVIFSFFSIQKNGWIAIVLLVFSIVSVVPPVDAFTTSRAYQINLLEKTLVKNDMLEGKTIFPKETIDTKDQRKITSAVSYLEEIGYVEEMDWLPRDLWNGEQFKNTFGFERYYGEENNTQVAIQSAYWEWHEGESLDIEGFNRYLQVLIEREQSNTLKINGLSYEIDYSSKGEAFIVTLTRSDGEQLMNLSLADVFQRMIANGPTLDLEQATHIEENEHVRLLILVKYIDWYEAHYTGEIHLFIDMKE